jgi:hypothetical protein
MSSLTLTARRFVQSPDNLHDRHASGLWKVWGVKNRDCQGIRAVAFPKSLPFVVVDALPYLGRFPNIDEAVILFSVAMDGVDAGTVLDLARVGVWAFKCVVADQDTHILVSFLMCPTLIIKQRMLPYSFFISPVVIEQEA